MAIDEDLERAKRDLENKIFFDKVIMKQVKVIFVERLKGARKKRRRVVAWAFEVDDDDFFVDESLLQECRVDQEVREFNCFCYELDSFNLDKGTVRADDNESPEELDEGLNERSTGKRGLSCVGSVESFKVFKREKVLSEDDLKLQDGLNAFTREHKGQE